MVLDPERNLLTLILAGILGVLLLTSAVMWIVLGRADVSRIAPAGGEDPALDTSDLPDTRLGELAAFAVITERPAFFADRRLPVVEAPDGEEDDVDPEAGLDEPVGALRARVAGIVITPEFKLAMVTDEAARRTVVMREGMVLEGPQSGWRLDEISPRQAWFVSPDGTRTELELKVNTSALAGGVTRAAAPRRDAPAREADAEKMEEADEQEARERAEEVRRRVAERRAQLRAEAERRARTEQQNQD